MILAFGAFRFDATNRLLFSNGDEISLQPKPLGVLIYFLRHHGDIVSKQELLDAAWDGATVAEASITEVVSVLRQTLGDDPRRPTYIQTIHRRGYRFIAPVSVDGERPDDSAYSEPVPADVEPETKASPPRPTRRSLSRLWRPLLSSLTVVVVGAVVVASWAGLSPREATPPRVVPFSIEAPSGGVIPAYGQRTAISPDGSTLVYPVRFQGTGSLYARALDERVARPLEFPRGTRGTERPFFSPDGKQLAYFDARALRVRSLANGEITTLCDPCGPRIGQITMAGGTWSPDGSTIVFAHGSLMSISANGGEPRAVPSAAIDKGGGEPVAGSGGGPAYLWPSFLPGGEWVLVTIRRTLTIRGAEIAAVNIETGEHRTVLEDGANARFVPSGHLVFVRDGDLWAAPFDPRALETTGPPALVIEGVAMEERTGASQFAVSDTGTLAYHPGEMLRERHEVLLYDREGKVRSPFPERLSFNALRFSPDGTRAALAVPEGPDFDIWIYDLEQGTHIELTSPGSDEGAPVWSPDGRRIAMSSHRDGQSEIIVLRTDGSTTLSRSDDPRIVMEEGELLLTPHSWSADGTIAYWVVSPQAESDIWVVSVADRKPRPFLATSSHEMAPSFSPDGRWLACDCGGEIRVFSYPDKETSFSVGGPGIAPRWGSNGNELYYFWNGIWMVSFEGLDRIPQPPRKLDIQGSRGGVFDVLPDGRGFGVVNRNVASPGPTTPQIHVVVNWFEELKEQVPTGR